MGPGHAQFHVAGTLGLAALTHQSPGWTVAVAAVGLLTTRGRLSPDMDQGPI